jgi:hypothetical protein
VTPSWEIQTTLGKAEYSKWVLSQLQPEFKVVRADEPQLTLSKDEDNDTHVVECQFTPTKEAACPCGVQCPCRLELASSLLLNH